MKTKKYVYILTIFLILNVFLDVFLTLEGVSKFGVEAEGNQFVKNFILNNKIYIWILWKAIPSILLLVLIPVMEYFIKKKNINFVNYPILAILFYTSFVLFLINLEWIIHLT